MSTLSKDLDYKKSHLLKYYLFVKNATILFPTVFDDNEKTENENEISSSWSKSPVKSLNLFFIAYTNQILSIEQRFF